MNNKITLGNTLNDLALLKLEHDKLRSSEDRRHNENDYGRAKEKASDEHIVVFETASNVFAGLAEGLGTANKTVGLSEEQSKQVDGLAELIAKGASGTDFAKSLAEDFRAGDEETRAVLASMPYAQDRADLLSLLERLGSLLTNQKPDKS